jgi:hypothetical protein
MTEPEKTRLKGRKPPEGEKRQFLVTMGPETIKAIKAIKTAAIEDDTTASELDGRSRQPVAGAAEVKAKESRLTMPWRIAGPAPRLSRRRGI